MAAKGVYGRVGLDKRLNYHRGVANNSTISVEKKQDRSPLLETAP